jgi:hypothetical protein
MAQGGHDIMGPIILASIGHLAPYIDVGKQDSLLSGMENMITRTGIKTNADPRNLDAEILAIMKADSKSYAEDVAKGGFYKWQEEHKALLAFLADAVNTAAYAAIMYASMTGQQRNQGNSSSSYEHDIRDAEIATSNRGEGVNYEGRYVKLDAAGNWQYYDPGTGRFGGYANVFEPIPASPVIGPGQIHHVISNPIINEVNKNPDLSNQINREDPQFKIQAKDLQSHYGYDTPHRAADQQTVNWLQKNPNATYKEFIDHLNNVYSQPAQVQRFGEVTFK